MSRQAGRSTVGTAKPTLLMFRIALRSTTTSPLAGVRDELFHPADQREPASQRPCVVSGVSEDTAI